MSMFRFVPRLILALLVVIVAAVPALAQAPEAAPAPPPPVGHGPHGFHRGGPFEYGGFEMGLGGKTVTGAPYSAQVVTQTTQTLSDGTHINRQASGAVYRDSQGRVRREMTMPAVGALTGSAQVPNAVFINDPVAGYHYVLHADRKAADRIPMPPQGAAGFGPGKGGPDAAGSNSGPGGRRGGAQVAKVSLGTQTIEGVQAEGTRITKTIPAGQIGNDKAVTIVTERWYSNDLQTVVMMKHSDPWGGETTFRLASINRAEPATSLFQVPADYTVTDRRGPRGFRGGRGLNGAPPPPPPGAPQEEE